jgi:hypothetical protein
VGYLGVWKAPLTYSPAEQVKLTADSAPAYAFLATIVKDNGGIEESRQLLELSSKAKPEVASYALNLIHAFEICNDYDMAYEVLKGYLSKYPKSAVGRASIKNEDILRW